MKEETSGTSNGSQPEENKENPYEIAITDQHALFALYAMHNQGKRVRSPLRLKLIPDHTVYSFFGEKDARIEGRGLSESLNFMARRRMRQAFPNSDDLRPKNLDEAVFVYISRDRLLAWVLLLPPIGDGKNLSKEQLQHALQSRGVVEGIQEAVVGMAPVAQGRYFTLHLAAVGIPPQKGRDGFIRYRYPKDVEISMEIGLRKQLDYSTLISFRQIKPGGIICEIVPPGVGTAGKTITGEVVNPLEDGKEANVPKGRNTAVSEDGKYLVATKAGNVAYHGNNFHVKPVLELENVLNPAATGPINYLGDIHIHGDVRSGAVIRAMGDIQIDGTVGACSIEASENIIILGGVQGQREAILQTHKGVYAKYLENCRVYADGRVQTDCLIESVVYCNGSVSVQTGRGVLVGGTVRSTNGVEANIIGSKAETKTNIILGGHPCDDIERVYLEKELTKMTRELEALEAEGETLENKAYLGKLRLNHCVLKAKMEKLNDELSVPCREQAALQKVSCQTAYPGTSITIGKEVYQVKTTENNVSVGIKPNGKIGRI